MQNLLQTILGGSIVLGTVAIGSMLVIGNLNTMLKYLFDGKNASKMPRIYDENKNIYSEHFKRGKEYKQEIAKMCEARLEKIWKIKRQLSFPSSGLRTYLLFITPDFLPQCC